MCCDLCVGTLGSASHIGMQLARTLSRIASTYPFGRCNAIPADSSQTEERESTASQGGAQHHLVYATVCTRLCVVGCVRVLHKHRVSLCITSSSHLDCASGRTSCRLLATRPPTQTAFCVRRQHPTSPDVPHTIITPDSIDLAQPDAVAQSSSQRRSYVASNYSTCKPNPFLPIRRRWSCRPAAQPSLL